MVPTLSIVIPAWNEGLRLGPTLARVLTWWQQESQAIQLIEILVVEDGSTDDTATVVRAARRAGLPGLRLLRNPTNRGKGFSVRRGLLAATGDWLLMCDADLATDLGELRKLAAALQGGADIAFASRRAPGAVLQRAQPWPRRIAAALFHRARRRVLLPQLEDTQCGFKLLRRTAAHAILPLCREDGWLFDVELLAVATRYGFRLAEIGITWCDAPDSRLRIGPWVVGLWADLYRIRRRVAALTLER